MNAGTTLPAHIRIRKTREQLHELTGFDTVSVSGLRQIDGGWELAVDVVELRRVPDTASVLATYRVTTDDAGDVETYERLHRYNRGRTTAPGDAAFGRS
jgi:Gas vesicle synthesis protein GvpO